MKSVIPFSAITWALVSCASGADFATERLQNWHQWRGPNANGVAPLADPPVRWSESENVKWKVAIPGKGSATPIVWNDRVFVLTAIPTDKDVEHAGAIPDPPAERQNRRNRRGFDRSEPPKTKHQFVVLCFDRQTGKRLWQQVATEQVPHEGHHRTGTFASGSPVTDGKHIYATFGSRGIYSYDMDGLLKWKLDLGDMRTRNSFGEGCSPALSGDTLIVPWDHEDQSFVIALNAKTGTTRWKVDRNEKTTWATPLVVDANGCMQVILHGTNRVRSYDLKDGRLIWECGGQASNPIASPVIANDLVYCMTGRRGFAVYAMPLTANGDITSTHDVAWHREDSGAYVSSPVVYKGLLYHTKACSSILSCLNAETGKVVFGPQRLPGLGDLYASPVLARDRIYITDRSGTTLVIQHGRKLEVLARNELGEGVDASFALVDKELFLRGQQHLYCIAER